MRVGGDKAGTGILGSGGKLWGQGEEVAGGTVHWWGAGGRTWTLHLC